MQGYLFSKPLPAEEFAELLEKQDLLRQGGPVRPERLFRAARRALAAYLAVPEARPFRLETSSSESHSTPPNSV